MKAVWRVSATVRSQPSSSFQVAGKRKPRGRLRPRHIAVHDRLHNFSIHIRITLVIVSLSSRIAVDRSVTTVGFVRLSFLQRRGPTAIKTVPAIDRQLASNIFISRTKTNTLLYIQSPQPLHQRIGAQPVRHYNDTLSTRRPQTPAVSHLSRNPLASQHVETASVSSR